MRLLLDQGVSEKIEIFRTGADTQIAFTEYGDPKGAPVFFCHGWPSSRTMAVITDDAARKLGVRIISPDRPGIRDSNFQPNRTLLDWPPVLCDLASHFGIDKFKILGISGGAPYAYATAWMIPERVESIAVVSGAPSIAELQDYSGLLTLYQRLLALRRSQPELLRILFHIVRPFASIRPPLRLRPLLPVRRRMDRPRTNAPRIASRRRRGLRGQRD